MAAATALKQPWVEKYRPKNVNEVAHQEEVVNTLLKALESANMPHLLFYGPPGTGKTSTALAIARQLYGPELMKTRVLELNASDERGINVVREKIKSFAATSVGQTAPGYPSPPYKLLILDEADSMTPDAQNALRRTMETYSKVTRFCFICNYVSRIIEPLTSRCAKFRFKPLHEQIMSHRIREICTAEGVTLQGDDVIKTLSDVSCGDLRKAITTLQSAVRLRGQSVDAQTIIDVSGVVPPEKIDEVWKACQSGRFDAVHQAIKAVILEGYPAQQCLQQLADHVMRDAALRDVQRAKILKCLAQTDKCLVDGADEYLQLLHAAETTLRVVTGRRRAMIENGGAMRPCEQWKLFQEAC